MTSTIDQQPVWALIDWAFLRSDKIAEDRFAFSSFSEQARRSVAPERIVYSVLEQDRPWWAPELAGHAPENIIEQPFDRGSVPGVFLAAMSIERRDANAWVHLFGRVTGQCWLPALIKLCRGQSPDLYQIFQRTRPTDVSPPGLDQVYPFLERADLDVTS